MHAKPRSRGRGFTLVEATVSIAIVALVMGVVMVSLSAGHADVRSAAGKLSGTIRASFDSAALTGQTYRLVFSFETDKETQKPSTRKIRVEATDEVLSFDDQGNVLSRGAEARAEGGGFDLGALMLGGT